MSGPRGALVIIVTAVLVAAAYLFWPAAPGVHMSVTVSNESPMATPGLAVFGPSARSTIGVVPPGQSRTVALVDPRYGSIYLSSDSTPSVLGLFDLDVNEGVTGADGSIEIRWTGAQPDPGAVVDHQEYGFVMLGMMRYRGMGPGIFGGVWPLRADDGTTADDY